MKPRASTPSPRANTPRGLFDQMAVLAASAIPALPPGGLPAPLHAPAVAHLMNVDRTLGALIRRVGPCRLEPENHLPPFAALAEAIVYQQLNGKAAGAILARVKGLFPRRRFPRPQDFLETDDDRLRAAGLSRGKLAALRDLSAKALAGGVPTARAIVRMPDEAIVERLIPIRGIGRWTVEMLLIFNLGRPDVLPVTDYGVRQGFALAYRRRALPTPGELLQHGERWRPHRSVAAWYLWQAVALSRG